MDDLIEIYFRPSDGREPQLLEAREFDRDSDPPTLLEHGGLVLIAAHHEHTQVDGRIVYRVEMVEP